MASSDLIALAPAIGQRTGTVPPMLEADKVSGFLIELAPGTTELADALRAAVQGAGRRKSSSAARS